MDEDLLHIGGSEHPWRVCRGFEGFQVRLKHEETVPQARDTKLSLNGTEGCMLPGHRHHIGMMNPLQERLVDNAVLKKDTTWDSILPRTSVSYKTRKKYPKPTSIGPSTSSEPGTSLPDTTRPKTTSRRRVITASNFAKAACPMHWGVTSA